MKGLHPSAFLVAAAIAVSTVPAWTIADFVDPLLPMLVNAG
jgi:hypothetical protein